MNIATLIRNTSMTSEMDISKKFKMAVAAILNLEKTVAILFDQSSPNFVGILLL